MYTFVHPSSITFLFLGIAQLLVSRINYNSDLNNNSGTITILLITALITLFTFVTVYIKNQGSTKTGFQVVFITIIVATSELIFANTFQGITLQSFLIPAGWICIIIGVIIEYNNYLTPNH